MFPQAHPHQFPIKDRRSSCVQEFYTIKTLLLLLSLSLSLFRSHTHTHTHRLTNLLFTHANKPIHLLIPSPLTSQHHIGQINPLYSSITHTHTHTHTHHSGVYTHAHTHTTRVYTHTHTHTHTHPTVVYTHTHTHTHTHTTVV